MSAKKDRPLVKLMVLGDTAVGKTNLLLRYCDAQFTQTHLTTLGIDIKVKALEIDGVKVKLQIWDTAGQERFRTLTKNYYSAAQGIVLAFAINDRESFENVSNWNRQIEENSEEGTVRVLVGNKCDLSEEREVSAEEAKQFASRIGVPYVQASAKDNVRVDEVFQVLVREVIKKGAVILKGKDLESGGGDKKKGCCLS